MSIQVNENDLWEMMMFDALHSTITVGDVIEALRRAKAMSEPLAWAGGPPSETKRDGVNLAAKEICKTISEKIPRFCISCFDHAYSKPDPPK